MRGKFLYLLVCLFLGFPIISFSQITDLVAGDVAITSFNSDGDDDFSFILLKDITAGTVIYFTDKGWDDDANGSGAAPTWAVTGEGTITWTSTSAMSSGTEVQVLSPSSSSPDVNVGTIDKSGSFSVASGSDSIIIYQGSGLPNDGSEVNHFLWLFFAGISGDFVSNASTNGATSVPATLSVTVNAINYGTNDNYQYDCSTLGALASLKTELAKPSNFTSSTSTTYKASGCSYYATSVNTWSGATDTDWNTAGNWSAGIPTGSSTVSIPNVANKPIISTATNAVVNNITVVDASSSLTINGSGNLRVDSNITNNGTFTIASDATTSGSLIVTGTATGNITYNRYMTGVDKWHLISASVGGQDINTFATNVSNNMDKSGVNYSLTPYNNTVAKGVSGTWNHWTSDGSGAGFISAAGNFTAGKGYEVLRTADGTMAFTGTVPVAQVSIAVTIPASGNAWNLIGNPFPSSIIGNDDADVINNFITVNTAALDASYVGYYYWDPLAAPQPKYVLVNQTTPGTAAYIAPGQGFFVKAKTDGLSINFTTAMRTNQSGVAFQKMSSSTPSISLIADNGNKIKTTDIKYIAGKTLGLDPGYDAGLFDAIGGNFSLYTKLVEDNGVNFMLQVLPDSLYDTTIVPIGLDADASSDISFKADATGLPSGKKVYLEDRLLNSFNEINNTDKFYNVTLSSQSQGIGRFYLRTLDNLSTLAIQEFNTLGISLIAHPKNNSIRIIGNTESATRLDIYDMLGRFIYTTAVSETDNNEVRIRDMAKGVYIVKIQTEKGNYNTKIAWY